VRLFVAVVPPPEAVADLEEFLEPRREVAGPRWSAPAQWHVTLAFAGAAPERVLEELLEAVRAAAAGHPPVDLAVAGGGCFPDVARARVLVAGVAGGQALTPITRSVRSALSTVGAAPAGGPFRPHLTLARFARPTEGTRWVRLLEGYRGPGWTAPEVVLVESHLPRGRGHRPRHEVLERFPLRA
jgi:2'-5' RNA ligase